MLKLSYLKYLLFAFLLAFAACADGDGDGDDEMDELIENTDEHGEEDGDENDRDDEEGDENDQNHDYWGDDCFDIVFPISLIMPDNSTITGANGEELAEKLEIWYQSNGESDVEPQFVFPVQVIFGDMIIDVASEKELRDIHERCEEEDYDDCFDFIYPISYVMPDGSTITGDDEEMVDELIQSWYEVNGESDVRPMLVLPVEIIFEHIDAPMVIVNDEDWTNVEEICDEHYDDDEYDCEDLEANIGDVCRLEDGTEGFLNEDCVCE